MALRPTHEWSPFGWYHNDMMNLMAGGVSGCISRTVVSPLERLKILYQVQYVTVQRGGAAKYNGVTEALRLIYKEEGIRGFYKGNGANCLRVFPYVGIQFFCFDKYKQIFYGGGNGDGYITPIQKLIVGSLAGATSVSITYPLDLVRGRLTVSGGALEKDKYKGVIRTAIIVYRAEGARALYQGVTPTLMGIAPYVGLNYLFYESLKELLPTGLTDTEQTKWNALCGGVAGAIGQTVAYPFDLLRRRFQMPYRDGKPMYTGVVDAFQKIVRMEGVLGLYKGYLPNFVKVVPTISIMFSCNDLIKRELRQRNYI